MTEPLPADAWANPRLRLGSLEEAVRDRMTAWDQGGFPERFWKKDPALWPQAPAAEVPERMGWLDLPGRMAERVGDLVDFADEVREDGFEAIVLLGMGGSSLAAETMARTFRDRRGYPRLHVLDSTHPRAVARLAELPMERTFFIVSSKSGTTLEPNSFFAYFWAEVGRQSPDAGQQFCAITDPGSPLESLAESKGFRQTFLAPPDLGGRYSALCEFGLVPAALSGVPIRRLIDRAGKLAKACGPDGPVERNPGLRLGAELGELGRSGRDKITFVTSDGLRAFPAWAEQLIAESTGKLGRGLVPVAGEVDPLGSPGPADLALVYVTLRGEEDEGIDEALAKDEATGVPALYSVLSDRYELGGEFLRWEIGVAAAGPILGIDPFDQPDVEMAKELAREAMQRGPGTPSGLPPRRRTDDVAGLAQALGEWLAKVGPADYLAVQAYLAPSKDTTLALARVRAALRARTGRSTTLGYGPRFLHSTGQLHKGGPNTGLFLQIVDDPSPDLVVPPGPAAFGQILRSQADGDAMALLKKQRRLLGVDVGADALDGLRALEEAVRGPPP